MILTKTQKRKLRIWWKKHWDETLVVTALGISVYLILSSQGII